MAIIRTDREEGFSSYSRKECEKPNEWQVKDHVDRIDQPSWIERYDHESKMLLDVCRSSSLKKALEFGSGPGVLGDLVISDYDISWTNIDKIGAKKEFEKRGYKGKFLIKNLHNYFDIEGMDRDYDLIVANDFLEHIANPSNILSNSYDITTEEAKIFVSVPNWRMGHTFIYRGIFDYDNFVYFMHTHGWSITEVRPSRLTTPFSEKLSSEESMPDELIQSWNWYFIGEKRKF
jgi:SAM-dependent methyltransferase